MHIEALMQLFCLNEPWSLGRRNAVAEPEQLQTTAPIDEFPYFASRGPHDSQFRVVGADLDECVERLLLTAVPAQVVSCVQSGEKTETKSEEGKS